MDGREITHFMGGLVEHFRNLLLCKVMENAEAILDMSKDAALRLKEQSINFTQEKIINCIKLLSEAYSNIKWAVNPRVILEITVIKLCRPNLDLSAEALLDRVSDLEQKLANGVVISAVPIEVQQENKKHDEKVREAAQQKKVSVKENSTTARKTPLDMDAKKAADLWPEIIAEIRKVGKLALFGHLADVRVEPINGRLGVIFKDSYATNKLMVSRVENIQLLEDIISKLSGCKVKVKCLLEKELDSNKVEEEDPLEQIIQLKNQLGDTMQVFDE
jgi:DNA polymerase-3 subunit gamma/tau